MVYKLIPSHDDLGAKHGLRPSPDNSLPARWFQTIISSPATCQIVIFHPKPDGLRPSDQVQVQNIVLNNHVISYFQPDGTRALAQW